MLMMAQASVAVRYFPMDEALEYCSNYQYQAEN
jgi:hypothetical protein